MDDTPQLQLQQFVLEEGYLQVAGQPHLVVGVMEGSIALVQKRVDDIHQRWEMDENGFVSNIVDYSL